jgi:hypothetical protein
MAAGLGSPGERQRLTEALAACPECRARAEALGAQREEFLASAEAHALETRLRAQARAAAAARAGWWRGWRLALPGVGLAAAAALVALLALPRADGPPPVGDEGRAVLGLKGGPLNVETFVRRGDTVLRADELNALRAGDALGFRVTLGAPGWVAVFGTDGGEPVAIVPPGGAEALAVPGGAATQLPASALLDGVGTNERFAVVYCPASFPVAAAREALSPWARTGDTGEAPAAVQRALSAGCTVRLLDYPKQ